MKLNRRKRMNQIGELEYEEVWEYGASYETKPHLPPLSNEKASGLDWRNSRR
jgi:hypothetical protein